VVIRKGQTTLRRHVLGGLLEQRRVTSIAICGAMSEMCVSATARTAIARGYRVVLPHDAHGTHDVPAAEWFDEVIPAAIASRAAEWALVTRSRSSRRPAGSVRRPAVERAVEQDVPVRTGQSALSVRGSVSRSESTHSAGLFVLVCGDDSSCRIVDGSCAEVSDSDSDRYSCSSASI